MVKSIENEEEAKDALKMGGLSVFFTGLLFALLGGVFVNEASLPNYCYYIVAGISLLFIVFAFRIRSGKYKTYPFFVAPTVLLFISGTLNFLAMLILFFYGFVANFSVEYYRIWGESALFSSGSILFAAALSVLGFQGMRGWLWFRRNKVPMQV